MSINDTSSECKQFDRSFRLTNKRTKRTRKITGQWFCRFCRFDSTAHEKATWSKHGTQIHSSFNDVFVRKIMSIWAYTDATFFKDASFVYTGKKLKTPLPIFTRTLQKREIKTKHSRSRSHTYQRKSNQTNRNCFEWIIVNLPQEHFRRFFLHIHRTYDWQK